MMDAVETFIEKNINLIDNDLPTFLKRAENEFKNNHILLAQLLCALRDSDIDFSKNAIFKAFPDKYFYPKGINNSDKIMEDFDQLASKEILKVVNQEGSNGGNYVYSRIIDNHYFRGYDVQNFTNNPKITDFAVSAYVDDMDDIILQVDMFNGASLVMTLANHVHPIGVFLTDFGFCLDLQWAKSEASSLVSLITQILKDSLT